MSNNKNTLSLQNSETSSSASSSPRPSSPNGIMNDYVKSVTERMIHLSVLEVGRVGNDGVGIVQLHNTFDFGASDARRTCACCAVLCASGCGCGRLLAEETIFNYAKNGIGAKFGSGGRGFGRRFGRKWRKNGRDGRLETIREGTYGRDTAIEQNGERARHGTAQRGARRRGVTVRRNEMQRQEQSIGRSDFRLKAISSGQCDFQWQPIEWDDVFQREIARGNAFVTSFGRIDEHREEKPQQSVRGRGGGRGRGASGGRGRRGNGAGRGWSRGASRNFDQEWQIDGPIVAGISSSKSGSGTYKARFVRREWHGDSVGNSYRNDRRDEPKLIYRSRKENSNDHFFH
ncbi:hypothetical protein niasHT_039814 [Heterodera trifolii]|uniref:Uncharacterized protein n=1 Tax=Heterodera trifolii TaxID=157864 RepID=A0ABD2IMP1_9BILA